MCLSSFSLAFDSFIVSWLYVYIHLYLYLYIYIYLLSIYLSIWRERNIIVCVIIPLKVMCYMSLVYLKVFLFIFVFHQFIMMCSVPYRLWKWKQAKAIYSELAIAREPATITCVMTDTVTGSQRFPMSPPAYVHWPKEIHKEEFAV